MDELTAVRTAIHRSNDWAARADNAIVAAYQAGHPLRAIAQASGRTVEGVRQLLKRRGVELRPPHVK